MVNKALLNSEVQKFVRNFKDDISKLAFKGSFFKNVTTQELIQQIESRNKIEQKLPTWFATSNILFPPKLNLEQTSSEVTAKYKASLVKGKTLADITGGFGIDSFLFSEKFATVFHFEINTYLSEIVAHNFKTLNKQNISCSTEDGLKVALSNNYDVIYADPSRRHDSKGKVFFLNDCQPNIPQNISEILQHCNMFLLKTSPMLDISVGLTELQNVSEIHIVAINNDVKELLWLLKKNSQKHLTIKTINFSKTDKEEFNFNWDEKGISTYNVAQKFLYEPNAAILKSGAFDLVSQKLKVAKLNKNTHLYTSEKLKKFPGRRFIVEKVVPYTKSDMRLALTFKKANISIRNFPETVATLRKKWKISEGGDIYLFFVTNIENNKEMIVCSKV